MTWTHERTEIHRTTVNHIGLNMFQFTKRFQEIRKDTKGCSLCRKSFSDDQYIHIAFTDRGNKLLCDKCSETAILGGATFVDKKKLEEE